ncbi:XTP/dITP diphosphohydrolase [Caloramator quimbayensis]|uniref:dITP/XTP pyrophosphatase n=1 Tax=Caloramator quimbayensis TaxID=1147123 RepID=A0A1T4XLJ6_9CLOT|nr:XTP/dITP diphosphatase [Caloramator quimbayensis]SKA90028.1 XTP/dITP diphosphohydrolase [Caloramator quimbayensis]
MKLEKIIIASNNKHKVDEIKDILKGFCNEILSLKEAGINCEVEENGTTFEENAYIKAKAIVDLTGLPCIADDSGLEVDALNGAPGVYSARFSGEHGNYKKNNEKLLSLLKGVPREKRGARFVTAIALVTPDGDKIFARGEIRGIITEEEVGSNGFGYDPLFLVLGLNKTFAQLSSQEKNSISHRGRALNDLKEKLVSIG